MVCCAITHSLIADMLWLDSTKVFLRIKLQTMALQKKNKGSSKEQDAVSQHALGRVQLCCLQAPWCERYQFTWNSRECTPDTDSFIRGFWITRLSGNFHVQINVFKSPNSHALSTKTKYHFKVLQCLHSSRTGTQNEP